MSEEQDTRISQVKRWLAKPPPKARRVVLIAATDAGTRVTLGDWDRDAMVPALADDIVQALDEHVQELRASVMATLSFVDSEGREIAAKVVRRAFGDPSTTDFASSPEQLTGDMTSQAAQAQRHLEVMMRMNLQHQNATLHTQRQMLDHMAHLTEMLAAKLADSEGREAKARREKEELEDVLRSATEDSGGDPAVDASQQQMSKMLEQMLPLIMMKMNGGGTPV